MPTAPAGATPGSMIQFATDSDKLRKAASELTSKRADCIVALAKSKMLADMVQIRVKRERRPP